MEKISFLGDIMCEEPFFQAAKKGSQYDFSSAFRGMKKICGESDYVIANLETPFASAAKKYTHEMYSFNTPDGFVDAVKEMGVSMVLTANNHCCDRKIDGLLRTLDVLDEKKLSHTGTYRDTKDSIFYTVIGNTKIAVIACTASTNTYHTRCKVDDRHVNLLAEQVVIEPFGSVYGFSKSVKRIIKEKVIGEKTMIRIRKKLGKAPKDVSYDDNLNPKALEPYLKRICGMIDEAHKKADLVFVCPHMGGQFNLRIGKISAYIMERLSKSGADAIIASHPHIVQQAEYRHQIPCFYSLGNVSMSMSTLYILRDDLPDYGLMTHFYLENHQISKVTFSVLKMYENADGYLFVRPVYEMYQDLNKSEKQKLEKEVRMIVERVLQNDAEWNGIAAEYELIRRNENDN